MSIAHWIKAESAEMNPRRRKLVVRREMRKKVQAKVVENMRRVYEMLREEEDVLSCCTGRTL